MKRREVWEDIARQKLDSTDPRFEWDPLIPTVLAGEAYQKAIALIVLGEYEKTRKPLSRVWVACRSKIESQKDPDFMDMLYWLLVSWLTEEKNLYPSPFDVIKSLYMQIENELQDFKCKDLVEKYEKLSKTMKIPFVKRHIKKFKTPEDEKYHTLFAKRLIQMSLLWLLQDFTETSTVVDMCYTLLQETLQSAEKLLAKRLYLSPSDMAYIESGDMELLKRSDIERFLIYKYYMEWREGDKYFMTLLGDSAKYIKKYITSPTSQTQKEALSQVNNFFRKISESPFGLFEKVGILELTLLAYVAGKRLLKPTAHPFDILRYFLEGIEGPSIA